MIWFLVGVVVGTGVGVVGALRHVRREARAFVKAWDDTLNAVVRMADEEHRDRERAVQKMRKTQAERRGDYGAN